jgi:hypothetical protein
MSVENVEKFYAKLGEDQALREKVATAGKPLMNRIKTREDFEERGLAETFALIEPFAWEAGFPFTLADLDMFQKEKGHRLTDQELDAAAGGGTCACVVGGGGGDQRLLCVIVGGDATSYRVGCFCFVGGGGTWEE